MIKIESLRRGLFSDTVTVSADRYTAARFESFSPLTGEHSRKVFYLNPGERMPPLKVKKGVLVQGDEVAMSNLVRMMRAPDLLPWRYATPEDDRNFFAART